MTGGEGGDDEDRGEAAGGGGEQGRPFGGWWGLGAERWALGVGPWVVSPYRVRVSVRRVGVAGLMFVGGVGGRVRPRGG